MLNFPRRNHIFRALRNRVVKLGSMSASYHQLLEATIQHLENLKARGVRFVPVSPDALSALACLPPIYLQPASDAPTIQPEPHPDPAINPSTLPEKLIYPGLPLPVSSPPGSAPPVPLLTPESMAKTQALAELRERAMGCVRCPRLAASRKQVVFGVGDLNAPLMFIGEAPGADEDAQGEPFVGRAGQLLTRIILAMGFTRQTVYIANIVKCRPDTPGQTAGNRKPTIEEMETCIPYLHQQIDLIKPKVIVALGATAVDGLLGKSLAISKLRGQWRSYRDIPLMPTFHPSYLLRPETAGQKRHVWEDMLQVMEKLAIPISEKQRNFFLKA